MAMKKPKPAPLKPFRAWLVVDAFGEPRRSMYGRPLCGFTREQTQDARTLHGGPGDSIERIEIREVPRG